MLLPRFDIQLPGSLAEASALLAEAGAEARLLAGGTDLLVRMKRGEAAPRLVISLGRLEGLDGVEESGGGLAVGPLATMSRLATDPLLTGPWAALSEGAGSVGGPVIRNRATVGGNIVNARPCADTVPPLIALGARLRLQTADGSRTAELDGFLTGPGETRIEPDEILTAIEVPAPEAGRLGSAYLKITRRAAMEVTIVGCAASVTLDETSGKVADARVVLTSVAPVPLRVPEAEDALRGRAPDAGAIAGAAAEARRKASPIDDHRAPALYRSEMCEVTARRTLTAAVERAGGRVS